MFRNWSTVKVPSDLRQGHCASPPVEATACPPCMIDQGDVWRMDVMDPETPDGAPLSTAFVAFQEGMPSRIRIESSFGPSWYDQLQPGKVSLD